MAVDKMVDSAQLDAYLTSGANAIRTKGNTNAALSFPSGFVSAIGALGPIKKDYVSGTFTVPSGATSYTLEFGKTLEKYIFLIELTDSSKSTLVASGVDIQHKFVLFGAAPNPQVNSKGANMKFARNYNPSSGLFTTAMLGGGLTTNTTSIVTSVRTINENDATKNLIAGYTYNYMVVAMS